MSYRGVGYGLSGQVANKVRTLEQKCSVLNLFYLLQLASKRDPNLEAEILGWIGEIVGEQLPAGNYEDILKDGVILCK